MPTRCARLLQEEGASARAVHSGIEALSVTSGHMFDVVVSDIAMPNMDGHALLRKLRENPRYAEVPAIACTGFNSASEIEQAKRSGFAAHLAKPVDVPRLIVAIQGAIAGRNRNADQPSDGRRPASRCQAGVATAFVLAIARSSIGRLMSPATMPSAIARYQTTS